MQTTYGSTNYCSGRQEDDRQPASAFFPDDEQIPEIDYEAPEASIMISEE